MQVTKKRTEFFAILRTLKNLRDLSGFKVSYAVMRIKAVIESEGKKASAIGQRTPEYEKLDIERDALAQEFATKDEKGKPMIIKGQYDSEYDMTPEAKEAFDKAFEELKAKHPGVYEQRQEQKVKLDEFLLEEVTLTFHDIKKEWLPENITIQQLEALEPFIVDLDN